MKIFLAIVFMFSATFGFSQVNDQQSVCTKEAVSTSLILLHTRFSTSESPPPDFRRWKASLDGVPLWEHEVYQTVGLEEEFYNARTYRRTTIALLTVSPAVFIASFTILLMEYLVSDTPILSPILMVSSAITFIIGLTRIGKRRYTYSEISPIVSDYNQMLLDDMRSLSRAGS